ncbi:MAG: hypothetical protein OK422_00850 [Thaumarchaeota archaeon]|nr:hypothetical protein [Nitrososphaerota archaeon]
MTHVGRTRKRYLLVSSESPLSEATRAELMGRLDKRFPLAKKRLTVWFDLGFIVKSDPKEVDDLKRWLEDYSTPDGKLRPVRTSGAIGKLKKLVKKA